MARAATELSRKARLSGESAAAPPVGFEVAQSSKGWHWTAYDSLGRVADQGVAPNRTTAAACLIRALSRT